MWPNPPIFTASTEREEGNIPTGKSESTVDHPAHYNRNNAIECIDEMELVFGPEATANFCLLNCWKYRYRAGDKNGQQDIEKSDWYMQKYKELKKKHKSSSYTMSTKDISIVPCNLSADLIK